MHVFVCGATGVLGRQSVRRLRSAGHDVTGLVRDDDGAETVRKLGGTPHVGDVFDRDAITTGVEGADAVVQAASKLPVDPPTTAREWRANDRVRLAATRNLLYAARTHGITAAVFPSVVWAYGDPRRERVTESDPANPDRTTASVVEAETLVRDAATRTAITPTILRLGWLYGPTSAQTQRVARQLLEGEFFTVGDGILGNRDSRLSMLHARDAARAILAALETDLQGTYHVVDDQPVTATACFERFALALGVNPPRRVPGWLAKQFVGEDVVRFLTQSFPTTNARFRRATGWTPTHPSIDSGLDATVTEWLDAGWLVPHSDGYRWRTDAASSVQCRSCGRRAPAFYDACRHCDSPNLRADPR